MSRKHVLTHGCGIVCTNGLTGCLSSNGPWGGRHFHFTDGVRAVARSRSEAQVSELGLELRAQDSRGNALCVTSLFPLPKIRFLFFSGTILSRVQLVHCCGSVLGCRIPSFLTYLHKAGAYVYLHPTLSLPSKRLDKVSLTSCQHLTRILAARTLPSGTSSISGFSGSRNGLPCSELGSHAPGHLPWGLVPCAGHTA